MDLKTLDDLKATLQKSGADAAIDRLCAELKAGKDFHGLFYAMLMKTRHALGVSPVPTGSNQDLPAAVQPAFEDGIRAAARTAGPPCLDAGDLPPGGAFLPQLAAPGPGAAAPKNLPL